MPLVYICALFWVACICSTPPLRNPTLTKWYHIVGAIVSHLTVNVCLQISIIFCYYYNICVTSVYCVLCIDEQSDIHCLHSEFKLYGVNSQKITVSDRDGS